LIRGAYPWDGPAKLTKAMHIGKVQNDKAISKASGLWIEDRGARIPDIMVKRTARIGVDYAGAWAKKPHRFVIKKLP
jgi:DNA-3-methyladenine glycosylase